MQMLLAGAQCESSTAFIFQDLTSGHSLLNWMWTAQYPATDSTGGNQACKTFS